MGSLRFLRQNDEPVDVKPSSLDEELVHAVRWGTRQEATRLLARGADPHAKTRWGTTALSEAVRRGRIEIAKCLIEHGANINKRDSDGSSPLMAAGLYGGRWEHIIECSSAEGRTMRRVAYVKPKDVLYRAVAVEVRYALERQPG